MALNQLMTRCSPEEVFEHLLDAREYPKWLLGASEIRDVDDAWPAVGSRFHHTVGWGPFRVKDISEIVAIDAPGRLELLVRVTPILQGHVTFEVHGCEHGAVLSFREEPAAERIGDLVRPALDPMTHVRNHRSLQKLVELMDAEHDRTREEPSVPQAGGR